GRFKIIVRLRPLAGPELITVLPSRNTIGYGLRTSGILVLHFFLRAVLIDPGLIGEHQHMFVFFVAEEVEDALLFLERRDEVEVRLAILHAVLPLWMGPLDV